MERFFYAEGYNRALDDVICLIASSDVSSFDDLVERLEKSKIKSFIEVEL